MGLTEGGQGPSRRAFLATSAAVVAAAGCRPSRSPPRLEGRMVGTGLAARGHRVLAGAPRLERVQDGPVDLALVGAGVAGLCAAWRLARAGFTGRLLWLDLGDVPGGTSMAGDGPQGPHPWGAHYITAGGAEAPHMRALLRALGLVTGVGPEGLNRYDESALCLAPQERLFRAGVWEEGLWPESFATAEESSQLRDFQAACAGLSAAVGEDGLPAFRLPVASCSRDPRFRGLADLSFAAWLDARGYTAPLLRWWLEYGTRDDYGTRLDGTSAWAGLHYHCARQGLDPDPRGYGSDVLTWPDGNGWLVRAIRAAVPYALTLEATALRVQPEAGGARLVWTRGPEVRETRARTVVLAVPSPVVARLLEEPRSPDVPEASPWMVANLWCSRLPASRGVSTAWDSVLYGSDSLGYVTSSHQSAAYGGPSILTWYEALADDDAPAARRALAARTWEQAADRVLTDLSAAHPDLRGCLNRLDVLAWGHGTTRPRVGLHRPGVLDVLARPRGPIWPAHTDLSGISLFEEAAWHGMRAAEAAMAELGVGFGESLAAFSPRGGAGR